MNDYLNQFLGENCILTLIRGSIIGVILEYNDKYFVVKKDSKSNTIVFTHSIMKIDLY